jgi:hypothetical protein
VKKYFQKKIKNTSAINKTARKSNNFVISFALYLWKYTKSYIFKLNCYTLQIRSYIPSKYTYIPSISIASLSVKACVIKGNIFI